MKRLLLSITVSISLTALSQTNSWTALVSGTSSNLIAVSFPTESIGFACGSNGTLIKTLNGGTTWTSINAGYPGYWFWDIHFLDENVGFIGGESDPGGNPSGAAVILKTTDGGLTWNQVYSNSIHPVRDLFVLDNSVIFASGGAESMFGAECKIIISSDGGSTWNQVGPSYSGNGNAGVVFGGMYFFDSNNGVMGQYDFLDQAYYAKTNDGCLTFNRETVPSGNGIGFWNFSTDFMDNSIGFMSRSTYSDDSVYVRKTVDGGLNWIENAVPNFTGSIYDLDFVTNQTGYLVGSNGVILKTMDGGLTWDSEISGTSEELRSVQMINNNLGFAVGSNGKILRYTSNLGLNEPDLKTFSIYPNPAKDFIEIKGIDVPITIEVIDNQGKNVLNKQNIFSSEIDVSMLTNGVYHIKISYANAFGGTISNTIQKFVKQ